MAIKDWFSFLSPKKKSFQDFGIDISTRRVAGVAVTSKAALELNVVYACIRDKAESVGQLPVMLLKNGGDKITSGRNWQIFTQTPNSFMSMQDMLECYVTCMELYGRFFAYVVRNKYGNVAEIVPFRYQQQVGVHMDAAGMVYYTYSTNDGRPGTAFAGSDIVHVKLNSLDGFTGISPIQAAAQSIGIAIAQEEHLSGLMESAAMPKGILTTDLTFKDENVVRRLREEWSGRYGGAKNSGRTPILENGLKYIPLGLSPADTELIKQRIFSRTEICSIFRVPPSRVGVTEAQRYNSMEENNRSYFRDSLMPLVTKIEFALSALAPDGNQVKLDERHFVRGDRKSQVESIGQEMKLGLITINEGRIDLGRQPVEGGDVHAIETNNITWGTLDQIPSITAQNIANSPQNNPKPTDGEVTDAE